MLPRLLSFGAFTPPLATCIVLACNAQSHATSDNGEPATTATTATSQATLGEAGNASTTGTGDNATHTSNGPVSSETANTSGDLPMEIPPCPYDAIEGDPSVRLEVVAQDLTSPVFAVGHPFQPNRLYVVQKPGTVVIVEPENTTPNDTPFLQVATLTSTGYDERGLLGFAFHPNYPTDPRVFVAFTDISGANDPTVIDAFDVIDDDRVDPTSQTRILSVDQPANNHNGGMLAFGPDGYLYLGLGDGGGADDQFGNGRNRNTLLSKMIRIDIDGAAPYTIPADNPFVDTEGYRPEIYASGLRNPWRFSFDQETGLLYCGDVGQDLWEEVDIIESGHDYGWSLMEGNHCFSPSSGCDTSAGPNQVNTQGLTAPLLDYNHSVGISIIGLSVYRACEVPGWQGRYFYADFGAFLGDSSALFALTWDGKTVTPHGELASVDGVGNVLGNGWNAWGDVYITAADPFEPGSGVVYRVAAGG